MPFDLFLANKTTRFLANDIAGKSEKNKITTWRFKAAVYGKSVIKDTINDARKEDGNFISDA